VARPLIRILAGVVLLAGLALAGPVAAHAQELPELTAPVNDFAQVIDAGSAQVLDTRIRALQAASGDAVVVVTIKTTGQDTIEQYAVQLFEHAGIGAKGKDNGVLMLVAVDDHRVRIETGYGLEEYITDGFAGETIRRDLLPAFRQGQYGPGLVNGATRIIQRIASARGVTLTGVPAAPARPAANGRTVGGVAAIVLIVIALAVVLASRGGGSSGFGPGRRRRGRTVIWPGSFGGFGGFGGGSGGHRGGFGGGGGGFGGFGGGMSGGGGASGGW
jgi:uncharacterized protein